MKLLHELLDHSPGLAANQQALRYQGSAVSYEDLRQLSDKSARGLYSLGVRRGDRVVVHLQNRPEAVEIAIACSRLGAILVPVSTSVRTRQLLHILRDSGATTLLTSGVAFNQATAADVAASNLRSIIFVDVPDVLGPVREGLCLVSMEDLRSASGTYPPTTTLDCDAAAILYTSGSTGKPKGVTLSHRNLASGAAIVAGYLHNTREDRILAALPLSFDYGLSQVTTALNVGATAVLTNFSTPAALIQEAAAERITGLAGVPTMWAHLAASTWPQEIQESLRYITNSGGALHPTLIRLLALRLPTTQLYCMYGLTEAFRSTYLDPAELDRRPGSIGKAIRNQEMLVLHADGTPCAPGEIGELVHRGSLVTLGYWNDPQTTAERYRPLPAPVTHGGAHELAVWSGDLVRTDDDGYLYFIGRRDHMIKISGYRVSPTEVEEVVTEVDGVIEVAAVGLPDLVNGQRIVVAIVARHDAPPALVELVRRHCRMHLPAYMATTEFRVVDAIPRNTNGKPDRDALAVTLSSVPAQSVPQPAID